MQTPVIFDSEFREALAHHAPCLVARLDNGEITYATRNCELLFGYPVVGELRGRSVHDLVPQHLRELHETHVSAYAKNPKPRSRLGVDQMEILGKKKNGETFAAAVNLVPCVIQGVTVCVVTVIDVATPVVTTG